MTLHEFVRWLDGYGNAWVARDPAAAAALFSADAAYYETPLVPPIVGSRAIHEYWTAGAQQAQRDVTFEATPIGMQEDRGLAHWRASFYRVPSKAFVELDGVLSARFDEARRCVEFREWWHRSEVAAGSGRYVASTEQLVAELSVRDLSRSLAFYRQLEFHVLREEPSFAVVAWEDHRLFLSQDGHVTEALPRPIVNVRVMVPDVDRAWRRVHELGLPVAAPIGDRHYGLRDFTILDPDGYGIRFATWLRTLADQALGPDQSRRRL